MHQRRQTDSDDRVMREVWQPMMQMILVAQSETRLSAGIVENTQLLTRGHPLLKLLGTEFKDFHQKVKEASVPGRSPSARCESTACLEDELGARKLQEAMLCVGQLLGHTNVGQADRREARQDRFSYEGMILIKSDGSENLTVHQVNQIADRLLRVVGSVQKCRPPASDEGRAGAHQVLQNTEVNLRQCSSCERHFSMYS